MGHPQGQTSPQQLPCPAAAFQHKGDLRLHLRGTTGTVFLHGSLEGGQAVFGIVEARDGLVQGIRRVIRQIAHEPAEGTPGLAEHRFVLRLLVGLRVADEPVHPPAAVVCHQVFLAVSHGDDPQRFPFRIAAAPPDGLPQECRHPGHILHHLFRLAERRRAQPLQDVPPASFGFHAVGIIDMPVAVGTHQGNGAVQLVQCQNIFHLHDRFLPEKIQINTIHYTSNTKKSNPSVILANSSGFALCFRRE